MCRIEAAKYQSKNEFMMGSLTAFVVANENDWLNEITSHMRKRIEVGKEQCREKALKYTTKTDFKRSSYNEFMTAKDMGWLDEITSHMDNKSGGQIKWTKEACLEAALKCSSKTLFKTNYSGAYSAAKKNGWLKTICSRKEWPI